MSALCQQVAQDSPDSKKVGCVITTPEDSDQFRAVQEILDESGVEQVIVVPTIADLRRNADNFIDYQLENVHDMIINGNYRYALELFTQIDCDKPEYKAFKQWLVEKIRKCSD
jgi:predicted O-methyltransferase YrrM